MLIKKADDHSALLTALENAAAGTGPEARRAAEELRIRKAGLKGEAESAYLIDFEFAASRNWAVLHDLRLEYAGRVAQIDHLLINRWLDFYVLESKHFHAGLKITDDGEFLRWNAFRKTYEGMPSPLEQNDRHIAVLRDVVATLDLPVRLGVRITPAFSSLVLVAPNARIDRPRRFDSARVIKADQLRKRIWKDIDEENPLLSLVKAAKLVSSETMEQLGRQLAALHRPLIAPGSGPAPAHPTRLARVREQTAPPLHVREEPAPPPPAPREAPACKSCGHSAGEVMYGKYGYYFRCGRCQGNTAIRFTCKPGHKPRLRKQGAEFFRDCGECGTSTLFHRNPA